MKALVELGVLGLAFGSAWIMHHFWSVDWQLAITYVILWLVVVTRTSQRMPDKK